METMSNIESDAILCSYTYMSKRDMDFSDCSIKDTCSNRPNGCLGCDIIVRLDLMDRVQEVMKNTYMD